MSDYIPLNEYGIIKVHGPDAFAFLQGQLTCDLRMVTAENPLMGAYCNQKGRVRALMRIFLRKSGCDEAEYFLVLPVGLVGGLMKTLEQFGMFSEVKFQDVTSEFEVVGVFGEDLDKKMQLNSEVSLDNKIPFDTDLSIGNKLQKDTEMSLNTKRYLSSIPQLDPSKILVFMLSGIVQRSMVILPKEYANFFYNSTNENNKKNCTHKWLQMDIESGMPEIWPETTELFLPHHLNMPKLGFINFKKGCFSGQEIIARMEYRTEIKRHLFLAKGITCTASNPDAAVTYIPDAAVTDISDAAVTYIPDAFVPKPGVKIRAEDVSPDIDIGTVVSACRVESGNGGYRSVVDKSVLNGSHRGIVALVELKVEFREGGLYIISDDGLRLDLVVEECGTFRQGRTQGSAPTE